MRDYTIGGFIAACLADGVTYFYVKDNPPGFGHSLEFAVPGLLAYFAYVGYKKHEAQEEVWANAEVGIGFLSAVMAAWVPIVLDLVLGHQ